MPAMNQTAPDQASLEQWRLDEKTWWERHSAVMAYQWKLTPELNKIIRQELEEDYNAYLFKAGGRLLDLGCGSGWLAASFAEKGMSVLGIDFSQEQIEAAKRLKTEKKLDAVLFECCDLVKWDCVEHAGAFDSIFVNAFLHHLPSCEIETIMAKISLVLKPGGRAFFYEPLTSAPSKRSFSVTVVEFLLNGFLSVFLGRLPRWSGLWSERYKNSKENGYNGSSPHERPLDIDWLAERCFKAFTIKEIKCWHLYSLGFAMQAMMLKKPARSFYFFMVPFLCWVDKVLLSLYDWKAFARPGRFILCSMKLEKTPS